jgi:hypothetical protein
MAASMMIRIFNIATLKLQLIKPPTRPSMLRLCSASTLSSSALSFWALLETLSSLRGSLPKGYVEGSIRLGASFDTRRLSKQIFPPHLGSLKTPRLMARGPDEASSRQMWKLLEREKSLLIPLSMCIPHTVLERPPNSSESDSIPFHTNLDCLTSPRSGAQSAAAGLSSGRRPYGKNEFIHFCFNAFSHQC